MSHCLACGWGVLIPAEHYYTGSTIWKCFACGWEVWERRDYMKLRESMWAERFGQPSMYTGWTDPGFPCPLCERKAVVADDPDRHYALDGTRMPLPKQPDALWISVRCGCAHCECEFRMISCPHCKCWSVVQTNFRLNYEMGDRWWGWNEWNHCASCGFAWMSSHGGSD